MTLTLVAKVGGGAELRIADTELQYMGPVGLANELWEAGYYPYELGTPNLDSRGVWHIPLNRSPE